MINVAFIIINNFEVYVWLAKGVWFDVTSSISFHFLYTWFVLYKSNICFLYIKENDQMHDNICRGICTNGSIVVI